MGFEVSIGLSCLDGDTVSDTDCETTLPWDRDTLGMASSDSDDVRWWLYGECERAGDGTGWCDCRAPEPEAGMGIGAVAELSVDVDSKFCRASVMALTQSDTSCAVSACK